MIDFEKAKEIAIKTQHVDGEPDVVINNASELTDSWVFTFADENYCFVPDIAMRVYKDDGRVVRFDEFSDNDEQDYQKKLISEFVVTEGCHW